MDLENHKKIAYQVNKLRTTWKAKEVPTDLERLLGTFLEGAPKTFPRKTKFRINVKDLPDSFDLEKHILIVKLLEILEINLNVDHVGLSLQLKQ